MLLALLALALVAAALLLPTLMLHGARLRGKHELRCAERRRAQRFELHDPGHERRAEQRARELLRSCVNAEEWAMYRDLGFIRVEGRLAGGSLKSPAVRALGETGGVESTDEAPYAYLIYPHKPIVAYVPATRRVLSEYCVEFPDLTRAISQSRLPDSDDVLAKWMALTGDERHLIRNANMHLPGRQIDPGRVRRDLWRLAEWRRQHRSSGSFEARQA